MQIDGSRLPTDGYRLVIASPGMVGKDRNGVLNRAGGPAELSNGDNICVLILWLGPRDV